MNNDDERDFEEERANERLMRDEAERPRIEVFVDSYTLAELIGVTQDTVKRWRYDEARYYRREPSDFPQPWGGIHPPGKGQHPTPVFALSEVFDWLARRRPHDLRIALEFGNVGHELGRLEERARERQSSKASRASV